jgi:DNA-binding NtrC family response regulator
MVEAESFRRDLYHRVGIFPIHIPSLAERGEDVPLLADSFLRRVAGGRTLHLSGAAIAALQARSYAGNIRELRNLIERASILADGTEITPAHLEDDPAEAAPAAAAGRAIAASAFVIESPVGLDELERRYLDWVDHGFTGDRRDLANLLGVGKRTLYRKLSSRREPPPGADD